MLRRTAKVIGYGVGAGTVAGSVYLAVDEGRRRSTKCLLTCGRIFAMTEAAKWSNASKPEAEQARLLSEVHRAYAPVALDMVLELKGYYIKMAQTMCGANILPKE